LPHEVTAFLQRERGKSKYYEYSEAIKSSAYI
jgi:cytochrome c2